MAVLPILKYPDPILLKKASPVTEFNEALQRLIDDMLETLYAAPGIGLAAPQVGRSLRFFVYDLKESEEQPRYQGVMINPEFISREGSQNNEEGCLSVSEYRTWVTRASHVSISGLDRDRKEVTLKGDGLLARLIQHEMDHLDGLLFINRISSLKRNLYLKRLKKHQKSSQRGLD
jgi:peptide deformylase